jgi:RNA polymerase sigma factor (sigma-70 family)
MTAARHADAIGPDATDAELAIAATVGDRTAFALIYERYADRLHDFSIGMLRDRDAAADCVQDAFCTAATKLTELREPDKLRPWLYAVTRNEALRRIRERRRELLSDEVPDVAATDAGPETLAARSELADLIAEAAGGLSDRDQSVLQLTYYHGLDGPELAAALDVSPGTANKLVQRLRETIERSLGALLVCRATQHDADRCPELSAILDGWDGRFTVLMRKRVARHIEGCEVCDDERRRRVNSVALLGSTPVFVPAPEWLRERTLERSQLPSTATASADFGEAAAPDRDCRAIAAAAIAGVVLVGIVVLVLWRQHTAPAVAPADFVEPSTASTSAPPAGLVVPPGGATTTSQPPSTNSTVPPPTSTAREVPSASPTDLPRPSRPEPPRTTEPTTTTGTTSVSSTTRTTRPVDAEESQPDEPEVEEVTTTRRLPTVSSRTLVTTTTITTIAPIG